MSDGGRVGGGGAVRGEGKRLWGDVGEGGREGWESCLVLLGRSRDETLGCLAPASRFLFPSVHICARVAGQMNVGRASFS